MRTLFLALGAALAALAALACEPEYVLDESLTELYPGDCVPQNYGDHERIQRIRCTSGTLRVIDRFDLAEAGLNTRHYPGDLLIEIQALVECPLDTVAYLGPTRESWENLDDRLVICFEEVR